MIYILDNTATLSNQQIVRATLIVKKHDHKFVVIKNRYTGETGEVTANQLMELVELNI